MTPEIERLQEIIDHLAPLDGRYVVRCDDGSIIATDELMDGDDVVVDRGSDY